MNSTILQSDLYLNPDPLVRLIGEPNEAIVKIEGQKFDSLIDSGAQISQLTESLGKALDLKIWNLKEILPLEGAAGIKVPYLGYVEARLEIPGVDAFNEDCLFLVMPDHDYGHRVPVAIGTLHIDMIIEQATKDELDQLGTAWGRGKVNRQSLKVKDKSTNPLNTKWVNVIIEPTDDEEGNYTIPAYTYLKSNSRSVHVGLRNMSCCTVTLQKGTVVAELSPTNAIPKMLAPKLASCQLEFMKNQGPKSNKL